MALWLKDTVVATPSRIDILDEDFRHAVGPAWDADYGQLPTWAEVVRIVKRSIEEHEQADPVKLIKSTWIDPNKGWFRPPPP